MIGPLARRGVPGLATPPTGGRRIPPALIAANQLFSSGEYAEAAKTYLNLAGRGIERGIHHAPKLYFQAAICYLMLGNLNEGLAIVRKAFDALGNEERWGELYRGGIRIASIFEEKGYESAALQIQQWVKEYIPDSVIKKLESNVESKQELKKSIELPTHCPSCGGGINPKAVEWVNDSSVFCDFCGSVVRGE
jgi:hypothetical protein